MKTIINFASLCVLCASMVQAKASDTLIVKDGQPRAEIIIADAPPRSTRLAAAELRTYVEKISGAKLPIATEPSVDIPVQIYIGQSSHTDKLKISTDGLKYGAYRMVSGENWLVLIGDDTDFTPREPWARNNGDITRGKLQGEWEKITGEPFGVPNRGMYKNRERLPGDIGKPDGAITEKGETLEVWGFDERGSFNAVCGFLRNLGVRWYLPGELGEVVPEMPTILLPKIDETVEPDFEVRQFNVRFATASDDTMMWAMRLGIRQPYGLMIAHGMHTMTHTETILREHPDWFALYGGKRDTQLGKRLNHLCYSNEELFRATVRWARAHFDVYDFETAAIMPPDAYISICQCDLCEGKDVPDMGSRGKLSNHVWDFVNRVAKEVGKTHPDKLIVCCAYGANTNPPTNIEKLEPNVQVIIVGGRRPRSSLPEQRATIRKLREGWAAKTDNPLMIFENYPFTGRGFYLPAFVARTIGKSINATKGVSRGEDIWLSVRQDFDTVDIGFNHFQVYFTARMYWGGPQQGVEAMLDEYCRLFYGPAGKQMRAFFDYSEDNYQDMEHDADKVDEVLGFFDLAKAQVDPDSVYAKRLALIDTFLETLRSKAELLSQKRGPVSKLRTIGDATDIVIDSKLDDGYWQKCPTSSTGRLRELQTGRQPIFGTSIKAGWQGGDVYFAIRCDERPGDKLNIATTKNEDQSIWYGDAVEILLDTDSHRYYQIVVNPAGALVDLDRGADKSGWFRWESQAEVATSVANDHWIIEIRIPVTMDENDPLNQVIGRKPQQSLPWHFNICRQRIRENGSEYSAFSPTGTAGFHEVMKFAQFYSGRSYQFDVDPTVTDYLIASRAAADVVRKREYGEAVSAYVALADGEGVTDFQKSDALEKAARSARSLEDYERAEELAGRIPIKEVAKTVRMENLIAQHEAPKLVEQFADEDFSRWPFWQIGAGAFARGRAYSIAKAGDEADTDLMKALEFTSDSRTRISILRTLGFNREMVVQNDDSALEAYQQITDSTTNTGGAEYYYGVQGATRILTRKGKFDEALAELDLVDVDKLSGFWRHSMLLARGETLAAAGRKDEAGKAYRAVLVDDSVQSSLRSKAETALKSLERK